MEKRGKIMKKICFITPQFKTGGGNRVFIELANILVTQGEFDIEIIFPNNSLEKNSFILNNDVSCISIGKFSSNKIYKLLNMLLCLFWIKFKRKNEILIITDPIMCLFSFCLPKKNTYRFIQADDYRIFDDKLILKNNFTLKLYKWFTLISYKNKNIKFIFNSQFVYDNFIKNSNRKDVPYTLVHPSVNKNIFRMFEKKETDKIYISTVARKHPLKGFTDFIDMWNLLEEEYKGKIGKIYIISHDDLTNFNLNDKKFIIIKPKSDIEIAELMNKTHIFISTSWWEGFGLPPLEALACGNKLLLSNSGGINEYAKNGYNCLIYEPKNIQDMSTKLKKLLDNECLNEKFEENINETLSNFSWEKSADDLKRKLKIEFKF